MDGTVRTMETLPLIDCNNEEYQQIFELINRGRKESESEMSNCIDWIDEIPPAFENPIMNWDMTIGGDYTQEDVGMVGLNSLLNVKMDNGSPGNGDSGGVGDGMDILEEIMESDIEDALRDVNIERFTSTGGDELIGDHLEEYTFNVFNTFIKEESSRNTDVKNFWDRILSDPQSGGEMRSCADAALIGVMMTPVDDLTGEEGRESSLDSYDSGGGTQSDSSGGSSCDDDCSSPESDGHDWFKNAPPAIVVKPVADPRVLMCFSDDEAENEEVDIMNYTDERLEVLCAKTRPKMTVLENVQNDHCYCSRVNDRSKPVQANDSSHKASKHHIPSPHKFKCTSRSVNNVSKQTPRGGQKNKDKCGRRKLAESSRMIASAKRNARGRVLKNASEKRQQLNQMERIRRGGLKSDFQRLRLIVPQTSSNPKAPKDTILQCALTTIITLEESYKLYEEEFEKLTRLNNILRKTLKQTTGVSWSKQGRNQM